MQFKRSILVVTALVVCVCIGTAFTKPAPEQGPANLKVLPKDISPEALDKIMDEFKDALGVNCDFCHAKSKTDPKDLDFASDEKGEAPLGNGFSPDDVAATFFTNLGINPHKEYTTNTGRPVMLVRNGKLIPQLLG